MACEKRNGSMITPASLSTAGRVSARNDTSAGERGGRAGGGERGAGEEQGQVVSAVGGAVARRRMLTTNTLLSKQQHHHHTAPVLYSGPTVPLSHCP